MTAVRMWMKKKTLLEPSQFAVQDVELLEAALSPGVIRGYHNEPTYEHLDFTWGQNAHVLVYPYVLDFL
eukprot:scaffold460650_cov38-Prasinocladus_malaysianus.AAC.1